ncbi:MAG: aspartyl/asparaginyl beta-hydroxylase domain-containing protein [Steroidobacteraceae bacterium]
MSSHPSRSECASLTGAALEALRAGDAGQARALLERATSLPGAGAEAWFALALAHRRLGSLEAEGPALDRTLELDPRHLPALIRKGDLYVTRSDPRAATSFYRAAVKIAGMLPALGQEWRAEIERISKAIDSNSRVFERHLLSELDTHGLQEPGGRRFARALEIMLGHRQVYLQQPQVFYFPELPQIQFYERQQFPWADALERETAAIREELEAILASGQRFAPYMQPGTDRPVFNTNGLLNDPSWSACHLIRDGEEVAANAALCPRTLKALRELPLCRITGRTPTVLFSLLRPGAHIPPHHGFLNTRLICHLPLVVPAGCALRVGNETRPWREGELVIFDDTLEHEAWNKSSELRVVLLFDIWRPELSEAERDLVARMLESIDRFGGPRQEWTQ